MAGLHEMLLQLAVVVGAILILLAAAAARPVAAISQPNTAASCSSDSCGNLSSIPFPFGTSPSCYLDDSFLITCNNTYNPPKPFLRKSTHIAVLNVSLDGLMRVSVNVSRDCYNSSGMIRTEDVGESLSLSSFFISASLNKFVAVGCDTVALVVGSVGQNYTTGCLSLCDGLDTVENGTCSGIGCCEISIPRQARDFSIGLASLANHSSVLDFNPCSYGFVVEEEAFSFSSSDLLDLQGIESFPVVINWAVGNESCQEAQQNLSSYACRALNSECYNSSNGPGYLCNCTSGYQGNPYLVHGCQDINECEVSKPCKGICTNFPGSFSCSCPKGYEGDGTNNGTGCFPTGHASGSTLLIVALVLSLGLLVLFLASSWVYWIKRKRKLLNLREKFFQQNGGLMLQRQLSKHDRSIETAKIFTSEDLKKATNNYDESGVIGQGGFGTVYRGVLPDNRVVAIKKSKISDQNQIEQFVNEVILLAQINHRNVVKLLGCCLETEVPVLVYEYIGNGTLSQHIHDESRASLLTWELRLKTAAETAGAIAYLHSAASTPIIHRDIKSTNILLDENYTAKVADFGASKLAPQDRTQLATMVQGTFGYLDPEYFHSSQLTEKSDVYSFGVVLAELLTGKRALSFDSPENERNLASYFLSEMKEGRLLHILDRSSSSKVIRDHELAQMEEAAKLAKRCLSLKGEDRPTMKEVATDLDGLRKMKQHPWQEELDLYPAGESGQLLNPNVPSETDSGFIIGNNNNRNSSTSTAVYDSMMDKWTLPFPFGDGR